VLDAWVVDDTDAALLPRLDTSGLTAVSTDLIMRDPAATGRFIQYGVKLATE
jgi:hypothetical protein